MLWLLVELDEAIVELGIAPQAGYLVLPTELALFLEPVVEEPSPSNHQTGHQERHISIALCLVVTIERAELLVDALDEVVWIGWRCVKLYDPLVIAIRRL